jgi:hypothetical protein
MIIVIGQSTMFYKCRLKQVLQDILKKNYILNKILKNTLILQ